MKQYLFDASALIFLIKKANVNTAFQHLQNLLILDLTVYEIGNTLLKENKLALFLTPKEIETLEKVTQLILSRTEKILNQNVILQQILDIAKTENLSFYDSSYIYFAKQNHIQLVTEDPNLKNKAQKYVPTQTTTTLLTDN
ncbi:MAG: type II toxin-antitoxin system VapC family toxin [Nitrososphaerota archaeon]|uniref:type II toxin-antitoxin system VapC family toxin n=1 Tax=Candidatus Bathycorpusculum sp. TaxID=2994959 RepID=UPI0028365B00|nr:type II toxin-antitoxin system VapC family toxin [Candidatus Termiticorpusculum sp.]MCL2257322.1 type II toxin-antitoxin system VapC family toxin [Candidatus Termiticorpusculum sp.]MCL2292191.1 type II toxin-antitoxin system VapC family toxin [Candidatus Termiticorpusculum sp.]MDR0460870.1 type II toxin-antitoxin system VapC family toxin [Nitrososphaerota archaeon]